MKVSLHLLYCDASQIYSAGCALPDVSGSWMVVGLLPAFASCAACSCTAKCFAYRPYFLVWSWVFLITRLCSCLTEIICSCQALNPMVVGGVYVGIKMAGWQIPSGKVFSGGLFTLKQRKMKRAGMRASRPAAVLKISCASLFWVAVVKFEFSTVSSVGFMISACAHPELFWGELGSTQKRHRHHCFSFTYSGAKLCKQFKCREYF